MLCCGGEKDSGRDMKSAQNTPSRQPLNLQYNNQQQQFNNQPQPQQPHHLGPPPLQVQPRLPSLQQHNNYDDFKKPTGLSQEVFQQIETVQNRYDSSTAAAFRAVQKSGEMVVRTLDPRQFIRLASETAPKINIDTNDPDSVTSFVEIVKRPGQTLGLYIREGNGIDRSDGVFISRIAVESAIYNSGCLSIGDEILAVNLVDVTRMSLDDVVIIMSIPRRLVLTTRRTRSRGFGFDGSDGQQGGVKPPVVVFKGENRYEGSGATRGEYTPVPPYGGDARTLTWGRNPKPDRNDPKYFPVNSLPRQDRSAPLRNEAEMFREDIGMPPPMRELSTGYPPMRTPQSDYYYAQQDYYNEQQQAQQPPMQQPQQAYATPPRRTQTLDRRSYSMQHGYSNRYYGGGRSRHYSGLDYASDTEALQSPVLAVRRHSDRPTVPINHHSSRSSSLPRTFQREALLRNPELSMEMDRLGVIGLEEQMSDSGVLSAPEGSARRRGEAGQPPSTPNDPTGVKGYRSPSSYSDSRSFMYKGLRRTPSTSAIYETLRRSKELRESLQSRPSSRMSIDNIPADRPMRDSAESQYFSDSEHQMVSTGLSSHRRMRNRTLSGLESLRSADRSASGHLRPITPSYDDKDTGQQFVDFNPADFIKYKSELLPPETSGQRLSGLLGLHLLSGRGLRTGGRARRIRDLYCVVEVDHVHKARTVVRSGGVNFDWDENFELDLINNLEVEFLIYSWDPQLRHRLCYRSSMRLAALFAKGQSFQQVALRLHPAGTLYLSLRFRDLREVYDRNLAHAPSSLFAINLETVLDREASGYLVPLLVKRCTEEVEKRGLDIIGIYRLCGAENKKKMLRNSFETSPETVDLSSQNVPDINVITGLLKEYLRELPEPVFSNCLYQMLVDAMGVFLPDDPDGNAKLVFSILDCLPKANRNCLVHIMDHLSRVTSQAARNKMTPQNLAICFAPVLMMDFGQHQPAPNNILEPIQILKYLIEIWPKNQEGL